MMTRLALVLLGVLSLIPAVGTRAQPPADPVPIPARPRNVLIELYTSQGCNLCPEAEEYLGELAAGDDRVVPIAFHVDYFNEPWEDPFSDRLYSERQFLYNRLYDKPKNPEYGIYYTPMLMVDGLASVNGRDPKTARVAIARAKRRRPEVALAVDIRPAPASASALSEPRPEAGPTSPPTGGEAEAGSDPDPHRTGATDGSRAGVSRDVRVRLRALDREAEGRKLLVTAVLCDDMVRTEVASGENGGKTLVARHPARRTKYDFVTLEGRDPREVTLTLAAEPTWTPGKLRLVVFVQDAEEGAIYQAHQQPWPAGTGSEG